jgi:hypothetical protein
MTSLQDGSLPDVQGGVAFEFAANGMRVIAKKNDSAVIPGQNAQHPLGVKGTAPRFFPARHLNELQARCIPVICGNQLTDARGTGKKNAPLPGRSREVPGRA